MDSLWFHQIILLAEPVYEIYSKSCVQSSNLMDLLDQSEEDSASTGSFTTSSTSQDDNGKELEAAKAVECTQQELSISPSLKCKCNRSQQKLSSPLMHRPRKSLSFPLDKSRKLHTFLNSKIKCDLKQVELKGFLDLGFDFQEDQLTPRTMTVIPGLQTFGDHRSSTLLNGKDENEKMVLTKPYLSDAWSVKKPNSPLLRLRMARVSTAQDMKECLKLWARIVASSIQSL